MIETSRAAEPPCDPLAAPRREERAELAPQSPTERGGGPDAVRADAHGALFPPLRTPPRQPSPHPNRRRSDGGALSWLAPALVYSGAALLGATLYQSHRSSAAEARHPPIGRFIVSDGATLHYVDVGDGPPLVLLHGVGQTLDDWFVSGVLDELLPLHRIIAIDRPGYGYSSRPGATRWTPERQARAIALMLHRLGAHDAVVVAHGFGVLPAMALALQHPTFARALVLVGGIYMPGSFVGRYAQAVPSVPLLGPLARGAISPAIARAAMPSTVRTMFEPQPVTRRFREGFSADFATRPDQLRAMAVDLGETESATRRFAGHYGDLDLPVTVITGSGDAIVDPDSQSRVFASLAPNARLVVIPAGGHLVHHSAPGRVAAAILDTASGRAHADDPGPPPDVHAGTLDDAPPPPETAAERGPDTEAAATRRDEAPASDTRAAESDTAVLPAPDDETPVPTAGDRADVRSALAPEPLLAAEKWEIADAVRPPTGTGEAASPAAPTAHVGPASAPPATSEDEGGEANDADPGAPAEKSAPKRRRTRTRRKPA